MMLPDVFRISLLVIVVGVFGGEIGPVRVLPDDRSKIGFAISATTTVYGFLDFTTKIDNTVVVFKPSTASAATSATQATVATIVHAPRRPHVVTSSSPSPSTQAPLLPPTRRNRLNSLSSQLSTTMNLKTTTERPERPGPRVYIRKRIQTGRRLTENNSQRSLGSTAAKLIPRRPVGKYQLRLRPTPTEAPVHVPVGDVTDAPRAPRHHVMSLQEARAVEVTNTKGFNSVATYTPTESPNENIAEYLPEDGERERPLTNHAVEEEGPFLRGSVADSLQGTMQTQNFAEEIEATAALPLAITGFKGEDEHSSPSVSADRGLTVPLQLSIVTSSFSLTETMLRTSLLPVYDGTSTTFYTLTQSFLVAKTVTSYQTVPPEEFMPYLIPGNNSINEIDPLPEASDHLERRTKKDPLILPHNNDVNDVVGSGTSEEPSNASLAVYGPPPATNPLLAPQGGLPLLNLLNPGFAAALGFNPYLAAAYGLGMGAPQVLTTSKPIYSTEVLMTEKLLPVIDGFSTSYETIRAPGGVVTHTSYETFTTTTLGAAANPMQHHALNPLLAPSTVTISTTYVTTEPITQTQVFKLVYDGYKTSYRTVSSISETTRTISTQITTTALPTAPTQLLPFFG